MHIDIPPAQAQQLAALATQHGYSSVEEYASKIVSNAVQLECFAAISPEAMEESLGSIQKGLADIKAGRSQPTQDAAR